MRILSSFYLEKFGQKLLKFPSFLVACFFLFFIKINSAIFRSENNKTNHVKVI